MRELEIHLEIKGLKEPDKIVINFDMPEMYMGKNEAVLKRTNRDQMSQMYKGRAVLPRCPSKKKLWRATIEAPGTGNVEFLFNVDK
ncbi:MAG: hypothetical protein L0Y62_07930 [Nitrospirae bacterium]|nr:hypothetical protein [Nitrospirota bacterium]